MVDAVVWLCLVYVALICCAVFVVLLRWVWRFVGWLVCACLLVYGIALGWLVYWFVCSIGVYCLLQVGLFCLLLGFDCCVFLVGGFDVSLSWFVLLRVFS